MGLQYPFPVLPPREDEIGFPVTGASTRADGKTLRR